MILRPYQEEAVSKTFDAWKTNRSTLLVAPTGCGKTQIFAAIIKRIQPRRALVLAHREELIYQAAKRIESLGVGASIEMADQVASTSLWHLTPAVVSTVQTQCAGGNGKGRMTRFKPTDFDLVIVDEAHHSAAKSYRRVLEYYMQNPALKVMGVTATPDRADEAALGQVFDSVAFDYEILDAIKDGWLVPVEQQMVMVDGLDYSHVRTTAGDLNGADLAAVMEAERNMQEVAAATLQIIGNRKTLIFTASVKQAENLAMILNRHREGMAEWVCGATPKKNRHESLRRFASGQTQVMANCAVLNEGYDEVGIEVVVQARPTKSRCLYAQMIGRGLRPLAGVVDGIDTSDDRRIAIERSEKSACLVIDFVGNAGRHKLMTTADILGGKVDDEVIARAAERARQAGGPTRTDEEIAAAMIEVEERRRQEAARKARLVAKAQYRSVSVDPFACFDMVPPRKREWESGRVLTEKQIAIIRRMGLNPEDRTYGENCALIQEQIRRWTKKLCTVNQARLLKRHGYETRDLEFSAASKLIDALARNNWRRPA